MDLNTFRARALPGGGARPTLFNVELTFPFSTAFADKCQFQIRATTIPMIPLDRIRIPYMGRAIKIAGDRPDWPDWTVTIMNDTNFPLRVALEKWSNMINAFISNRMNAEVFPNNYKGRASVTQKDRDGSDLRRYIIDGIFPVNIDQMPLDWEAQNVVQQFDATFSVDWIEPDRDLQTNQDDYSAVIS